LADSSLFKILFRLPVLGYRLSFPPQPFGFLVSFFGGKIYSLSNIAFDIFGVLGRIFGSGTL
jgi:hypothetical protein